MANRMTARDKQEFISYLFNCTDQQVIGAFQKGEKIIIPAGITVRTMHPSRNSFVTKRRMTVTVHHTMPGQQINISFFRPKRSDYPQFSSFFDKYEELLMEAKTHADGNKAEAAYKAATEICLPVNGPRVCWPGSGGYWNEVDETLVTKAEI